MFIYRNEFIGRARRSSSSDFSCTRLGGKFSMISCEEIVGLIKSINFVLTH